MNEKATSITAWDRNIQQEPSDDAHVSLSGLAAERLPIAPLSQGIHVRADGLNKDHVKTLADAPGALPPIVIHRATMTVVDGVHRIAAARARGDDHIEAVLFDGNVVDAYLLALRLNSLHGLPLSRKDRRAAVKRLLGLFPSWSDRRVASVTGVSHKTVGAVRSRSTGETAHSETRFGMDGRERPLNVAEARRQAAELLSEQPTATVRQVAASTGLSPATVHDVRRRMTSKSDSAPAQDDQISRHSRRPIAEEKQPPTGATRAARSIPSSSSSTLQNLRSDPSIHGTIAGRTLLQVLSAHAQAFLEDVQLAQAVPAHRREAIAHLARQCGDAWLNFASEIERSTGPQNLGP